MTAVVRDNPDASRYEIYADDELAGFTDYRLSPGRIAFTHTEIEPAFEGRGLARRLVVAELDDARRRGLAVLPFCPYVRTIILRNQDDYLDLVPASQRARFKLPAADPPTG